VIDTREDLMAAFTGAFEQMRGPGWRQFFIDLVESMPRQFKNY
jgi:hypothetical protein